MERHADAVRALKQQNKPAAGAGKQSNTMPRNSRTVYHQHCMATE